MWSHRYFYQCYFENLLTVGTEVGVTLRVWYSLRRKGFIKPLGGFTPNGRGTSGRRTVNGRRDGGGFRITDR